jgi:glycosyltransferase involved in cell wall biosynthesis
VEAEAQEVAGASRSAADAGLVARLELELPDRLPVGRGNAVFVYGHCFHSGRRVRRIRILADGRAIEPMAERMPRLDLPVYRSAFWGIVPFGPTRRARVARLELAAELDDGAELRAPLGELELVPAAPAEPAAPTIPEGDGPLVAICMATYDPPPDLLRAQLDSIRAQTHERWVCVISDDRSDPDRFADIKSAVGDDPRFAVSRSPERLGFYANFERAVTMAPAEATLLALCDQDDAWHPDKLEVLLSEIGDAELVYSDARIVDEAGTVIFDTYWSRRRPNHTNLASLLITNTITGAASLFRRELLDRALPFPTRIGAQWHDHWLALVAVAGGEVRYVDRPLYDYVQHSGAVVGHDVANPGQVGRPAGERLRMLGSDWREAIGGWCRKYFYGVCKMLLVAEVLELRCGDRLRARRARALRRFRAIDSSPLGYAWLSARRLRRFAGRNETLDGEALLLHGLAWRRIISALTWRRESPPRKLLKDAALPPPGGADTASADPPLADSS